MSAALYPNPLTILRPQKLYPLPITRNGISFSRISDSTAFLNALRFVSVRRSPCRRRIRVFSSGEGIDGSPRREVPSELSLDAFLSFAEVVFIVPPTIYSLGCAASMLIPDAVRPINIHIGSKAFAWQFVLLVCAVVTGVLIRRRQWGRICRQSNGVGVDLLSRIEKVEEDLRSSATMVRVLSRQLEKLGIRFRVTRKALKEPITEAAVLAQKNSEAARALAMKEDILEKELGETQKVLLAMQEQQQKQLELILAIVKSSRAVEGKQDATDAAERSKNGGNSVSARNVDNSNSLTTEKGRTVNNWKPKPEDTAEPIPREPRI